MQRRPSRRGARPGAVIPAAAMLVLAATAGLAAQRVADGELDAGGVEARLRELDRDGDAVAHLVVIAGERGGTFVGCAGRARGAALPMNETVLVPLGRLTRPIAELALRAALDGGGAYAPGLGEIEALPVPIAFRRGN